MLFFIPACMVMELVYIFVVFILYGFVQCSLLMGKSHVAPLKRVTVRCLKLAAAVLFAKLCSIIQNEMDFSFSRVCFSIDASVVLRYILNSSLRFETFIANSIKQLHGVMPPDQ